MKKKVEMDKGEWFEKYENYKIMMIENEIGIIGEIEVIEKIRGGSEIDKIILGKI